MDRIARYALFPVLLAQALQTRRRALTLPEAEGPRAGHSGTGPLLRLLILGDSSGAGVGVAHQDQALSGHLVRALSPDFTVQWHLLARTGATSDDALNLLKAAGPVDVAVIALGVNDVTRLRSARRWKEAQNAILEQLELHHGARLICVTPIPPMGHFPLLPNPLRWTLGRHADRLQTALTDVMAQRACCHPIDFDLPMDPALMARDGFHPGPQIYRIWGETTARMIRTHSRCFLA